MSTTASPKRFEAALMRSGPLFQGTGVNLAALRRDAGDAVRLAVRLHGYQRYLQQARAFKAGLAAAPSEIDREVLDHGRQAATDGRMLAASFLKTVRGLHNGGALDKLAGSWRTAVQTVGTVSAQAEWDRSLASPTNVAALRNAGADDDVVAALAAGVRSSGLELHVEGTHLVATANGAGGRVSGRVNTAPRPARPSDVVDLLTRGRFEALVAASAVGQPAYLEGVPLRGADDVRLTDVALLGAFDTHYELVRHVRKLEDTGLTTVQGAGIPTIIAVALVLMAIGALIMIASCSEEPPSDACAFGSVLSLIGIGLLFSGPKPPDPNATNRGLGGPIVHGILRGATVAA